MRQSRAYWEAIVREFEETSDSHAAFCDERGLHMPTFRGWLYRIRKTRNRSKLATPMRFVSVEMPQNQRGLEIEIAASAIILRSESPIDAEYVGRILRIMRAS